MRRAIIRQLRILVVLAVAISIGLPDTAHERSRAPASAVAILAASGLGTDILADLCLSGDPDEGPVAGCSDCLLCKALVLSKDAALPSRVQGISFAETFAWADWHIRQPGAGPPPARAPPASLFV